MTNAKVMPKTTNYREPIMPYVLAIIAAILFRAFVYQPYYIPTGSMKPNLLVGDYIFVSKFSYGYSRYSLPFGLDLFSGRIGAYHKPQRGDIVVFRLPKDPSIYYIKRLIGLPGDKIQLIDGIVYINGEQIKREYAGVFTDTDGKEVGKYIETLSNGVSYYILKKPHGRLDNTEIYEVPAGEYFFMGDNRDDSIDSRVLNRVGYVPDINLIGKAEVIFFSSKSPIWQVWTWLYDLNLDRFFTVLSPLKLSHQQ